MTPPRSVLATWRALEAAEAMRTEFGRHIEDLETLSAAVRTECHRLDGDGWQGAAFEAMFASVEAAHRHDRMLCDQAGKLCAAGASALSDLHYTVTALLGHVADAEAAGCAVADDWTVIAGSSADTAWPEIIAEAVAAVDRAEECGRRAVLAVEHEMRHLAAATIPVAAAQAISATSPAATVDSTPAQSVTASAAADSGGDFPAPHDASENTALDAVSTPLPPQQPAPSSGITAEQLTAIMPDLPMDLAQRYLPALDAAMREGDITTPGRKAAFLAQLAHESCEFRYFEELGDDAYFHRYDPGQPDTAAGNTQPGDGPRYHGRGPIQLTGRANYRAAGQALGLDLEGNPELAAQPDVGFRIAQWYWTSRNINALADAGDFAAVTRAVNGGYNGLQARETYYRRALEVLG